MLKALAQQRWMLNIARRRQALLGVRVMAGAQPREGLLESRVVFRGRGFSRDFFSTFKVNRG